MKTACVIAFCLTGVAVGFGMDGSVDSARQEYESISSELINATRKWEKCPEMERLGKALEEAQMVFEKEAFKTPEIVAFDNQKKTLDTKLVTLREKCRAMEMDATKTGGVTDKAENAHADGYGVSLKDIRDEISKLEVERRRVKEQIGKTIMELPALAVPRKMAMDLDAEIKQFKTTESPEMKEIRGRLDAARNRLAKLTAERQQIQHSKTNAPAKP